MKRFLAVFISILILTSLIPQNVFAIENQNSSTNGIINISSIGELASSHNYQNNENTTWVYTCDGAGELNIVFSNETSLENGSDFIYLYDKNDNQIGNRYTGTKLSGITVNVPGDTVKIKLVSDNTNTDYGFSVDDIIPMERISVSSLPTKTNYYVGQDANYSGLKIQGVFKDETSKEISSGYELSDVDNTKTGKQTVLITYNGLETEFEIEFVEPIILSIEVVQLPNITNYYYGDDCELNLEGLILKATDDNGNDYEINKGYTTSNLDCNTLGKQNIVITYKEQSAEFEINVLHSVKYTQYSTSITITGLANSSISNLKIPEKINDKPVTAIADSAFNNTNIVSVELPESISNIGSSAFRNCVKLSSVNIPNSITTINTYAFYGCSCLAKINLPENLASIKNNAFENCTKFTKITIPSKVEEIGAESFSGCTGLSSEIEVPDSVKSIGVGAFKGTKPTSMKLPFVGTSRTASNEYGVFGAIFGYSTSSYNGTIAQYSTTSYTYYYYIPTTVKNVTITDATNIPKKAFYNCNMLESIITNTGFNNVGEYSFYNCDKLTSYSINDETTTIGKYAFYGCSSLEKITLPDNLTSIKNNAFENCTKFTKITIPSKVEEIGAESFSGCTGLSSEIEVPDSVKSIGVGAFKGTKPTSMKLPFVGTSRTASNEYGVFGAIFGYSTSSYNGTIAQYSTTSYTYYYYIPTTVKNVTITDATNIPKKAFYNCNMLNYILLPDGIETIGNNSFRNTSDEFLLCVNKDTVGYTYAETNNISHSSTDKFTLNTNNLSLYRNEKSSLKPHVIMYNGKVDNTPNITWSSSNPAVASVNNGVVSAVAPGTTTIIAKCDDKTQTVIVNVYFKLESISFTQSNINIDIDKYQYLYVNYNPYNTSDSKNLTYTSSDESVATVSESGKVTAKSKGSVTITAKGVNGVSAQCKVNVLVPIESLSLNKTKCTIDKTETLQLNANISPANTTDTLSWSSSDVSIASVDSNGLVTPYRSGNVTITVTSSRGKKSSCEVNILSAATSISIDENEYNTFIGCKKHFEATMEPYDVTDTIAKWESSDESVVTVDDHGAIEAVGKGSAKITVTTTNGKESSCVINVENDISKATLIKNTDSVDYNGAPRTVDFVLMYNGYTLSEDLHYTIDYKNNINAGKASVNICGINTSVGEISFGFEIKKVDLKTSNAYYIPKTNSYVYNSEPIPCPGDLYIGNEKLSEDDYSLEYKNNIEPGTATLKISGKNNCCGTIETTYNINYRPINDVEISIADSFEFSGKSINPKIQATYNGKTLEEGKDFLLEYKNNTNVGKAIITIYGKNCFNSQISKSFIIRPKKSNNISCSLSQYKYIYNGKSYTPDVILKDGKRVLKKQKDYTVVYSNNSSVGTAKATVSLIGNYSGKITKKYYITPKNLSNIKIKLNRYSYSYAKNTSFKPKITIKYKSKHISSSSYDIKYYNNRSVGTAKAVVRFKGNYSGTTTAKYSIYPFVKTKYITVFKGKKTKIKVLSNAKIKYKSSNSKIAKINNKGIVTGIKKGTVNIKAISNKKTITAIVAVKNPYLNRKKSIIFVGDKLNLRVTGGSGKIKWNSNKKSIATVKSGKVNAKKKGTVTISAKRNGIKMKCKISVKGPCIIIPKTIILHKGDTRKIYIKKKPRRMKLKWNSSNKKIAKIKNGEITGISKGKAKIIVTGTYKSKKYKAFCNVTVKKAKIKIFDIGDYRIGITKATKIKYHNENILIVTYYFENNSDSTNDFNWAIFDTLYQNGIEIDKAYPIGLSGYDSSNQFREILPGASLKVQVAYKLRNPKKQIKATLRELFDTYKENMAVIKINL